MKKPWIEKGKETKYTLILLIVVSLIIILISIIFNVINLNKTIENKNINGLREINIYCSDKHNHPLFQERTICAYVPNLKIKLAQLERK